MTEGENVSQQNVFSEKLVETDIVIQELTIMLLFRLLSNFEHVVIAIETRDTLQS